MSTRTENKRAVIELFARVSANDIDGAMALVADDVSWRVPGKPELLAMAGLYDKKRLRYLFDVMRSQLQQGLAMTVVHAIAEDDCVAAEVEGSGELKNGRSYRQQYHFMIRVRDGKIATVHEYFDTLHAHDIWIRR
ncbi:MAG TPA: nuclear transport factor 2 family protein [Kofleriaceae bacterium]|nr:nuclear transport factor 2 family protein [Kofleriaceae bacterium]